LLKELKRGAGLIKAETLSEGRKDRRRRRRSYSSSNPESFGFVMRNTATGFVN
jgi:hypothetical protein